MEERAALGWALHRRADDVAAEVLHGLPGNPSYEVLASIAAADRLATQVVGRWLATGEGATEHEHEQLSGPGALVGIIDLPTLVKAYLAWRDAAVAVLEQEGARLACSDAVLAEARDVIERSCDASLTALPNRTLLYDRVAQSLHARRRYGGELALLFVDLDGFKGVNDRCGHEAGERLLVAVTDRLRHAVRPSDTLARLGGDEFIVLCDRLTDAAEAEGVAD